MKYEQVKETQTLLNKAANMTYEQLKKLAYARCARLVKIMSSGYVKNMWNNCSETKDVFLLILVCSSR